jgi:hypothetical protein
VAAGWTCAEEGGRPFDCTTIVSLIISFAGVAGLRLDMVKFVLYEKRRLGKCQGRGKMTGLVG